MNSVPWEPVRYSMNVVGGKKKMKKHYEETLPSRPESRAAVTAWQDLIRCTEGTMPQLSVNEHSVAVFAFPDQI